MLVATALGQRSSDNNTLTMGNNTLSSCTGGSNSIFATTG